MTKLKDLTEEQRAVLYARTNKHIPGAFSYMLEQGYLKRDPKTKEWKLNEAGHVWLAKYDNWKP